MMCQIVTTLESLDRDPSVGCFVITGNERAFAAGADIKELAHKSYIDLFHEDYFVTWERFTALRTPKVAAVSGYALGGGCELALMCDVIYASETAKFGQPEIKLGLTPGMGGSQRLTKLIGKGKSDGYGVDRTDDGRGGSGTGRVSGARVFGETFMADVLDNAQTIASYSKVAAIANREAVERAQETSLREGLLFERRTYHALWATRDANEGMQAFIEKRKPVFDNQ